MIISQTPLRVSFVGGGTDFPEYFQNHGEGAVLSTAIDKFIYVIVKDRFDNKIRVGYSVTEMVDHVDELRHELVREAMKMLEIGAGIEIATMADIPSSGSGLGSSSSVTVGILNALHAYRGESVSAEQLAQEACHIEIERLGKPVGKQDQYIAAHGGFRLFRFLANGTVTQQPVAVNQDALRRLRDRLLLLYVGFGRDSAPILSEQRRTMSTHVDILKEMSEMPQRLCDSLDKGEDGILQVGEALRRGWELKQKLATGITNGALNRFLDLATEAGATGGKILGAGGGGFMLLFSDPSVRDRVRSKLSELSELPFNFERDGSKIIFNIRR